jgi:diketogulonate reductase-like aldo/keto reductase
MYDNEMSVGAAIKECGIARNEIFLTTKQSEGNLTPLPFLLSFSSFWSEHSPTNPA